MTFKTHSQISKGLVDPAPLVDVVFLLLLFFILSSPFVLQSGLGVLLPSTGAPTLSSFQGLVVTVTRENLLFFNNQPTTLEHLQQSLQAVARQNRNAELIIKVDQQVPYGTVVQLMDVALKAGLSVVNYAARPEVPVAAGTK
jgi:biopolymer transport protein ExbD